MRYPAFLKEKGTIGFPAPSFGAADEWYGPRFDAAEKKLEALGYRLLEGPNARKAEGIGKSNTPEKCAEELMDLLTGNKTDALISVGGGETMCEDLSFLDFEALGKAEPKWFMGYSDNTNLTFTLATLCDTASVYGQCSAAFGQKVWHESLWDDLRILAGKTDGEKTFTFHSYPYWEGTDGGEETDPTAPWHLTRPSCMKAYAAGCTVPTEEKVTFEGRLLGGCLDVLQILCGTRFDRVKEFGEKYASDGIVWFMEACDLNPVSVRRALWQLREAGWFSKAKGFIFGRPYHYGEEMLGLTMESAVLSALKGIDVPVLLDTDLGHLPPAIPYITGSYGIVTAEDGKMELKQILR